MTRTIEIALIFRYDSVNEERIVMGKSRAEILGENLKRVREEKGVSRKQLAEILSVGVDSVGLYERGERLPPLDKIFDMANFLQVSVTSLTGDNDYNHVFPVIPDIDKEIFKYRFERALQMATDLLDSSLVPKIADDGSIIVYSPEKIKYDSINSVVSYYGGYNAIAFKNAEDFVNVMERAEHRALYSRIEFNQAFRVEVFVNTEK